MLGRIKDMKLRYKIAAGAATGVMILGGGGAAFAYFTTTGSGSGTAATGNSTGLTITQTNTVSGLTPGGGPQTIDFSISNPHGNGAQNLGAVTVTVTHVTSGNLASEACDTSMYVPTLSAAVGTIADGGTATGTATISMTDDTNNQDNCQAANGGGALTLHFSAAQGS